MVALNDLSPDKQWEVRKSRAVRSQLEDWAALLIVGSVVIALRFGGSHLQLPGLLDVETGASVASPGYELFTKHLIDDSPPNSYDFTLVDPATDSVAVPLPSPCDGKVSDTRTTDPGGYGQFIEVACSDGHYWFMAHLASVSAAPGDVVRKGETLGIQGSTGNSTGEHIHLEIAESSGGTAIGRSRSQPMVSDYLEWLEGG